MRRRILENDLAAEAKKQGFTGRRAAHYIYGGMNNLGAMHGNQPTAKGAAMEAKHVRQEQAATAAPMRRPKGGVKQLLGSGSHGFRHHSITHV